MVFTGFLFNIQFQPDNLVSLHHEWRTGKKVAVWLRDRTVTLLSAGQNIWENRNTFKNYNFWTMKTVGSVYFYKNPKQQIAQTQ